MLWIVGGFVLGVAAYAAVLLFALALCRAAAAGDALMERARFGAGEEL